MTGVTGSKIDLDAIQSDLASIVLSDPLLSDGAQDTGPIVDLISDGQEGFMKHMEAERINSVNR